MSTTKQLVYISDVQAGMTWEGQTITLVERIADGRYVIHVSTGASSVPMRGDHKIAVKS